ncbi:MAG TPA: hypothetical protein EYG83_04070 [Sulfurospirillum arcachonense]|nr:hypothetical protein [Sulfurospirillum arcachonense]
MFQIVIAVFTFSTLLFSSDLNTTEENFIDVTTLTFRQNIYRKWLFYEVSPGVNFSKKHDFDPNYRFYLRLDAFFGKM